MPTDRISNDQVYEVVEILRKHSVAVLDVPIPDGRRLRFPCWLGPVAAAMGSLEDAEDALDDAGFIVKTRWKTQLDRKRANGRFTVVVAPG